MPRRFLASSLLLLSLPAAASPLNPWGATVGEGVVGITPFLYVDQTPAAYPLLYAQYGVSDSFELLVGAGATIAGPDVGSSFDSVELMPRFFFSETSAAVLHATWAPGAQDVEVGPEYHGAYSMDALDLTVNLGWAPSVGASGFGLGTLHAILAPERYLTDSTSLFLEINPSWDLNDYGGAEVDRLYVEVVPGVSTSFADTHYVALGVAVPVTGFDATAIYAGAWYSIAFGG
jgi:hypothetical protein